MNRDQNREHPTWAGNYLKLEKKRECKPMPRDIFAQDAFAPTPSLPKRGDLGKVELLRVGDREPLGWEGPHPGSFGSVPFRQRTTISAVLFLKCS